MALAITLLIPAYNEAERLGDAMARFDHAVAKGAVDLEVTEVIVVDDGSSDGTAEVAERLLAAYPHHRVLRHEVNQGKGAAVRTGVRAARTPEVAFLDADMSLDPIGLPSMREALTVSLAAVASRTVPGSIVDDATFGRVAMSRVFNFMVTAGTGMAIRDTQCGFKAFRTPVARLLFHLVRVDGFAFDVEILRVAHLLGMPITEVPVRCHNVGGSTVHPARHAWAMLSEVRRSRNGGIDIPPVAALTIRGAETPTPDMVAAAVRPTVAGAPLPVLSQGGAVTVLLPLVGDDEVEAAEVALVALSGAVERTRLSVDDIIALGPLAPQLATTNPLT